MDTTKLSTDELRAYWEERAAALVLGGLKEPLTTSFNHPVKLVNLGVGVGRAMRLGDAWSERASIFDPENDAEVILIVDNTATAYDTKSDPIGRGLVHIVWTAPLGESPVTVPVRYDAIGSSYSLTHGGDDNTRTVHPNANP